MKPTIRETKPAAKDDQVAAKEYGFFFDEEQVASLVLIDFKWTLAEMDGTVVHRSNTLNDAKSVGALAFRRAF